MIAWTTSNAEAKLCARFGAEEKVKES